MVLILYHLPQELEHVCKQIFTISDSPTLSKTLQHLLNIFDMAPLATFVSTPMPIPKSLALTLQESFLFAMKISAAKIEFSVAKLTYAMDLHRIQSH